MTAGGSLTNANWPALGPALLHLRRVPSPIPRGYSSLRRHLASANARLSTPPGHYSRSVHDGRERNNTRLLGSESRAAGQGTLISGPKQFEAVTNSDPRLPVSGPRPRPLSLNAPAGGEGGRPPLVGLLGRHLPSSSLLDPIRSSLFGLWTRSFPKCRHFIPTNRTNAPTLRRFVT
jgi:hypothetical protein